MNKFKLITNYLSDGIMEIDDKGCVVFCNKKAAELDDIIIDDIMGKPLFSIYPSLNKNTSTLYKVLNTGETILNFPQTFTNYKGREIATINSTIPLIEHGKVIGAMEISRDVTDVKLMTERIVDLQNRVYKRSTKTKSIPWDSVKYDLDDIITQNKNVIHLKAKALKASTLDVPILICGDTGTGKELFVQSIHKNSDRSQAPFIAQNCAALPASLLEGILFGTREGAFTGAKNRAGLLEAANGGTVFLDEINSMPIELQAKLLRFLQDGWLRRIGDNQSKKMDIRVIAALNVSPEDALKSGQLRKDLYYRLNTITIELPSLKERKGDIIFLAEHFIKVYNRKLNRKVRGLNNEVVKLFESYNWPGNIRELEHVIEGAISMLDGTFISLAEMPTKLLRHLDSDAHKTSEVENLKDALHTLEKNMIFRAMLTTSNNVTEASKKLGIPRQTLQYKLKRHKIDA